MIELKAPKLIHENLFHWLKALVYGFEGDFSIISGVENSKLSRVFTIPREKVDSVGVSKSLTLSSGDAMNGGRGNMSLHKGLHYLMQDIFEYIDRLWRWRNWRIVDNECIYIVIK